ncbi:MAG: LysR family transcriptional regulator [Atopobiaceae bacterium]|nr:LysR family transcriptional regulator [Atopobiaceae bacterium]
MEIRTLRYFLAVAQEENMTRAAARLHLTQPTLSKALKSLEAELDARLFVRHSFSIELTDEGRLLRDRARDLVGLADKIEDEFRSIDDTLAGELRLGMAESYAIRLVARELRKLKKSCPGLRYHVTSGDTEQVTERLDRGLLDFAVLCERPDTRRYDWVQLPERDLWGVVMRDGHPLAQRAAISPSDLMGEPLFASEQGWRGDIAQWAGDRFAELRLEGTFRLAYNASVFAREGLGLLLTFDRLVDTSPESGLVFRPLEPSTEVTLYLVWGKRQLMTPVARRFVEQVRLSFES